VKYNMLDTNSHSKKLTRAVAFKMAPCSARIEIMEAKAPRYRSGFKTRKTHRPCSHAGAEPLENHKALEQRPGSQLKKSMTM